MSVLNNLADEIFSRYGSIKRARGPFLYTEKGDRLTDLFLEGGRAILGWGSEHSSAFSVFKNVISRGNTGSYHTDFNSAANAVKSRLSRAVSELFGTDRTVFVFDSKEQALKASLTVSAKSTSIFKPWNPENVNWQMVDSIVFAPPLAWADSCWFVAVSDELLIACAQLSQESKKLPSPLEAAFTRSIYDLIKALQVRQEKDWFKFDKIVTTYWQRKGPYLYPKMPEEKYQDFVKHCLDCRIVISPDYNQPSIVPFGAELSVFKELQKSPFIWN